MHNILPCSAPDSDPNAEAANSLSPASGRGMWADLPMEAGIATLVSYAGVFGDVIGVEAMAARLGVTRDGEFNRALNDLVRQGRLLVKDGYAGLPHLAGCIATKPQKETETARLIEQHAQAIVKLGRSHLVRFIGISGSVAAGNPVRDRTNQVDVDVFIVTRSQCLWICVILEKFKVRLPWRNRSEDLCIGHVMDESNLLVTTQNFYTATEVRNLIPVSGMETHRRFLAANKWVNRYYPGTVPDGAPTRKHPSGNRLNRVLFWVFLFLRAAKLGSLKPLKTWADPMSGVQVNRLWSAYGGYQPLIQENFCRLAARWFPDLIGPSLIGKLFPDEFSRTLRQGRIDVHRLNSASLTPLDFSKYGSP
jgi:hypothetical protein